MRRLLPWAALAFTLVLVWPAGAARAFCGFYVDGGGAPLYNNATQVVMMREGTRTILSMQNNYQGPPEAFAMVVPVPVVLQKDDVRTLDRAIFARVDALDAPRLVEYWEQDPCRVPPPMEPRRRAAAAEPDAGGLGGERDGLGVKIEAQFVVGEYEVVVLSATDSTGLATWLAREKYALPDGAAPYLRPYVEGGWKFFVAKVDPSKVTFKDGMATLSPLRFHYDSDDFTLPVRLGLVNSAGTQDLIVHVLAAGRVEVANRPAAFVPTNLDVGDDARDRFAELYAALFDRTIETHPRAVVTEYAWDARSCDPCPQPPLGEAELATLGADVLPPMPARDAMPRAFTLTRLHVRYGKADLAEDLVFHAAAAVTGGREARGGGDGRLDQGAQPSSANAFQARYAIRHRWTGPIACSNPRRGVWGPPPAGTDTAGGHGAPPMQTASNLAFAPRGKIRLDQLIAVDVPALNVHAAGAAVGPAPVLATPGKVPPEPSGPPPSSGGKGCCGAAGDGRAGGALVMMFVVAARWRRRKPRSEA